MADFAIPLLLTVLLWWSSSYDLTLGEISAALILAVLPWVAYRTWHLGDRKEIPLFVLVGGMYWLAYALPLFWSSHDLNLLSGRRHISEQAITSALYLSVTGVIALWAGMKLAARFRWVPEVRVDVSGTLQHWHYLRIAFVFASVVKVLVPITALGEGGRQILFNFENMVPTVIFVLFLRSYLRNRISDIDKFLLFGYVLAALVVGISSGWLGSFVGLGLVSVVVYIYERRKFPVMAALTVLPVILFFQAGKNEFRDRYWQGRSGSYSERVAFWVESSWRQWSNALTDTTGQKGVQLADTALNRLSLLQQTANVIELTPGKVPYQHGRLYSYIGITFIPRFLWPDKPSVNDANHWYQVSYGLTAPRQLSSVSIAVGTLAESYINFGWIGPVLVMFLVGIFLGSVQRIFLRSDSGLLFSSMGAVLVPQLVTVESQMAEYVAGLAQQVLVVVLVLIPVLKSRAEIRKLPMRRFPPPVNQQEALRPKTSV